MKLIKKFENFNDDIELSDYFIGEPDKQYVDFESTHDPFETSGGEMVGLQHNSFSSFRKGNRSIKPTEDMVNSVIDIINELVDSIDHHKYYPEFKQIYFYTWSNKPMSYGESSKANKKVLIISFYKNDWIFVSLIDENDYKNIEKHSICKGLDGLREFIIDKKDYISKK